MMCSLDDFYLYNYMLNFLSWRININKHPFCIWLLLVEATEKKRENTFFVFTSIINDFLSSGARISLTHLYIMLLYSKEHGRGCVV